MVVFDPEAGSCRIFEIKHSEEAVPQQYRHLIDEQKCAQTEHRYGPITGKFVLYRGESQVVEDIQYQNVEEYLRNLAWQNRRPDRKSGWRFCVDPESNRFNILFSKPASNCADFWLLRQFKKRMTQRIQPVPVGISVGNGE